MWSLKKHLFRTIEGQQERLQIDETSDVSIEMQGSKKEVEKKIVAANRGKGYPIHNFDKSYSLSVRHADDSTLQFINHLEYIRAVKFGHLYQNPDSGQYWYKSEDENVLYRVNEGCTDFFFEWLDQIIPLSNEQINIITEIGGIERGIYGNDKGNIKIPCRITRCDGTILDPAIICITNRAPVSDLPKSKFLGSAEDVIEPSDYALPLDIRVECARAEELRMCFCPTWIISPDGEKYIILGMRDVYNYNGIPRKDMRLPDKIFHERESTVIVGDAFTKKEDIHFVYYDWFEGCLSIVPEEAHEEQFDIFWERRRIERRAYFEKLKNEKAEK